MIAKVMKFLKILPKKKLKKSTRCSNRFFFVFFRFKILNIFSLVFSGEFYKTCQIKSDICFFGGLGSLGGIWGHLGSNPKIIKPGQIRYQNEALGPVVTKNWFSRYPDPKFGIFGVISGRWGHNPNILNIVV